MDGKVCIAVLADQFDQGLKPVIYEADRHKEHKGIAEQGFNKVQMKQML